MPRKAPFQTLDPGRSHAAFPAGAVNFRWDDGISKTGKGKAIVLLSGGLDSATALAWAQKIKKWDCRCLLFDYGQRHRRELRAAKTIARRAGCPVHVVRFRLPWGGSSLIDKKVSVPAHALSSIGHGPLPNTYVPARNTIFIAFALSWADAVGAENLVIGANALDYSGYPDCRPGFLRAMQSAGRLGTRLGAEKNRPLSVWAPLLRLSKAAIIRKGMGLGVPYALTWSCYRGGRRPCGTCDSCRLRAEGFRSAKLFDPAIVRTSLTRRKRPRMNGKRGLGPRLKKGFLRT